MKPAFDLTSIRMTLRKAVEAGHFTVEMLDTPSNGFVNNANCDRRTFPGGYQGVQFRNLLRDDVVQPERVQVIDPKDLPPMAQGVTPAETKDLPQTLDDNDWF